MMMPVDLLVILLLLSAATGAWVGIVVDIIANVNSDWRIYVVLAIPLVWSNYVLYVENIYPDITNPIQYLFIGAVTTVGLAFITYATVTALRKKCVG